MPNIVMSSIGDDLFQRFIHDKQQVERLEKQLNEATHTLGKSRALFGRWLLPIDAERDKPYNLIVGNNIITCTRYNVERTDFSVEIKEAKFERQEDIK